MGIVRFGMCRYKHVFRFVYTDSKTAGFPKGWLFPWFWVSNRGESALLAHDFAIAKSSVLYLLRPLLPERGCCLTEHNIFGNSRTGGFCEPPVPNIRGFAQAKSGCSGVGGAAERREF